MSKYRDYLENNIIRIKLNLSCIFKDMLNECDDEDINDNDIRRNCLDDSDAVIDYVNDLKVVARKRVILMNDKIDKFRTFLAEKTNTSYDFCGKGFGGDSDDYAFVSLMYEGDEVFWGNLSTLHGTIATKKFNIKVGKDIDSLNISPYKTDDLRFLLMYLSPVKFKKIDSGIILSDGDLIRK